MERDYPSSLDDSSGRNSGNNLKMTEKHEEDSRDIALEDQQDYPHGLRLAVIMIGLCLCVFCVALDNTIIATAIPEITDNFHSLDDIGWYSSAYLLCNAAFQLFFGKLYSIFPIKWVYMIALAIFEIGSLVCGAAPTSTAFIVGRAVAGLGSAGLFSGSLIIVAFAVPLAKRPTYSGLIIGMFGIASVVGPLLGGAFTDDPHATWRMCFYINLPLGFVTAVVLLFLLKPPTQEKRASQGFLGTIMELDPFGTLAFVPSIVCLLLALQWGGTQYAWSDGRIIALFVVFGILFIAFVGIQIYCGERRSTVPPRIATQRNVAGGAFYGLALSGAFFILIYFLPIWFQAIKGTDAVHSGIDNLPMILSQALGSILAGALITNVGQYVPFMIVGTIMTSVGAGLLMTFVVDTPTRLWIGYQIIFGFGIGLGFQQPVVAAQATLPLADVPVGTAFAMFCSLLGGALFTSVAKNRFSNALISNAAASPELRNIDPTVLSNAGATELSSLVPASALPALLTAYNGAVTQTFEVALILGCLTVLAIPFMQWISVKGKQIGPGG